MNDSPLAGPEWAGFLTAMRFRGDDTDFLVAADWLQDVGRPEFEAWAEFVRCQVASAAEDRAGPRAHVYTDSCDCDRCRPERRAAALFDRWAVHWAAHSFPQVEGVRFEHRGLRAFSRGFPASATVFLDDGRVASAPGRVRDFWARAPLRLLRLTLGTGQLLSWRLCVVFTPTPMRGLSRVRAELEGARTGAGPFHESPHTVCGSRLLGPRNQFGRAVGGAVRDVLRRRMMSLGLPPSHPDLGGEG